MRSLYLKYYNQTLLNPFTPFSKKITTKYDAFMQVSIRYNRYYGFSHILSSFPLQKKLTMPLLQ